MTASRDESRDLQSAIARKMVCFSPVFVGRIPSCSCLDLWLIPSSLYDDIALFEHGKTLDVTIGCRHTEDNRRATVRLA